MCVCVWWGGGGGGVTMVASYILKQNKLKLNDDISQIESFLGVIQVFKSEMYVCLLEELIGWVQKNWDLASWTMVVTRHFTAENICF